MAANPWAYERKLIELIGEQIDRCRSQQDHPLIDEIRLTALCIIEIEIDDYKQRMTPTDHSFDIAGI